jgi:hypothetical protein
MDSTTPHSPGKAAKPMPDFPLFPHATRRGRRRSRASSTTSVRGKIPTAPCRNYRAFLNVFPLALAVLLYLGGEVWGGIGLSWQQARAATRRKRLESACFPLVGA